MNFKDMKAVDVGPEPGTVFGSLTVCNAFVRRDHNRRYWALCSCVCGSEDKPYRIDHLKKGHTTSCGCVHRATVTKHGSWEHPLYKCWSRMMNRCSNPKDTRFKNYGGRGIKVCERWHDLNNFIDDMYSSFFEGASIERKDVHGDYEASNCEWIPMAEQAQNKTTTIRLTHNGETLDLKRWAERTGVPYGTLWDRHKMGWSDERIVTTPSLSAHERCAIARSNFKSRKLAPPKPDS